MIGRNLFWNSLLLGVVVSGATTTGGRDVPPGTDFLRKMESTEFMQKMESAIGKKKRGARVTKKLMNVARRVEQQQPEHIFEEDQPRFLEEYQDFAVNLTEYALKYIGCQNIHTYDEDLAADEDSDSVLGMDRFVIVRLCPQDECSNYNEYGCLSGFGDYLIAMEDYLQIMSEDYFDQFTEYCETCYKSYQCVQALYQNDDGANDGEVDGENNNNGDDDGNNANRRLDYNYYYNGYDYMDDNVDWAGNGDDDAQEEEVDYCSYIDACGNWMAPCKDGSYQMEDMEDYFECADININGNDIYVGPHCRSDGKTIGIGIYSDENCNVYNSDLTDVSAYTGLDLSDDYLKPYYSDNCISCLASDGFVLDQDENDDEVAGVCGSLYYYSAKCNRYMGYDGDYNSYNQEQNEDVVCNFISNLIENTYDEYGEILLESGWQSYVPTTRSLTTFQKWALPISLLIVVILLAYSCYLHRVIRMHRFTWMPRPRKGYSNEPGSAKFDRTHSGIISGRSRSGFESKGGLLT